MGDDFVVVCILVGWFVCFIRLLPLLWKVVGGHILWMDDSNVAGVIDTVIWSCRIMVLRTDVWELMTVCCGLSAGKARKRVLRRSRRAVRRQVAVRRSP